MLFEINTDPETIRIKEIADHFGLDTQLDQLTEEMGELLQAISKYRRHNGEGQPLRSAYDPDNLAEELADVSLVLEQVIYLLGVSTEVRAIRSKKIDRVFKELPRCGACRYHHTLDLSAALHIDLPDEDCHVCTAYKDLFNSDRVLLLEYGTERCCLFAAK